VPVSRAARPAGSLLLAAAAAHYLPSVATVPALHRGPLAGLAGQSPRRHVALTFDDGPDPASTPQFLDALDRLDVRATFFVLGCQVGAHPGLARELAVRGHEIAVHGLRHRPHLLRSPWAVQRDVADTVRLVERAAGTRPAFWRPPNGVISGGGLVAARRQRLRPVLWTADGRDWTARATPESVSDRVLQRLGPGGTVLLHDSDITSAPGSWRSALGALPALIDACRAAGWAVGPLHEHW